jgi:hypothetical protein
MLLAMNLSLHAADTFTPSSWKWRQKVDVARSGPLRLTVPWPTVDKMESPFAPVDFRLTDPEGRLAPWTREVPRRDPGGWFALVNPQARLLDGTTTLDAQWDVPTLVDAVELRSPAPLFLKSARVDVSLDGSRWKKAAEGAPLFRQAPGVEQLRIEWPAEEARFVRVTVKDNDKSPAVPIVIERVRRSAGPEAGGEWVPAGVVRTEERGQSRLTLNLSARNMAVRGLRVRTGAGSFARRVRVSYRDVSEQGVAEVSLLEGTLHRLALPEGAVRENLVVKGALFAPLSVSQVELVIFNGDAPPLPVEGVDVEADTVAFLLNAPVKGTYTLYAGAPRDAGEGAFDLAGFAEELGRAGRKAPPARWGDLVANPDYRTPAVLPQAPAVGAAFDGEGWTRRAPVAVAAEGLQSLDLPLTVVAVADPMGRDCRIVLDGVQVPYLVDATRPESAAMDVTLKRLEPDSRRPRVSRWEVRLPAVGSPVTGLEFPVGETLFERRAVLLEERPGDRDSPSTATLAEGGWIRRTGTAAAPMLWLRDRPRTDRLILEVDEGDNPSLALTTARIRYRPLRLLFKAAPGRLLWLYYGNPKAAAPRYDLALLADDVRRADKAPATAGGEEVLKSPFFSMRSLAGGNRLVFFLALAAVTAVLLLAAKKLLPGEKK